METRPQTEATTTASRVERRRLEASWVVNPPESVQISQQRARKFLETYEATLDGGAVDHPRLLGRRAWPRFRVHLTHLRKQLVG